MVVIIILIHFIFDWWLQSRWMANNKSSNWSALAIHCVIYGFGLVLVWQVAEFLEYYTITAKWTMVNFAVHLVTDAISAPLNKYLYKTRGEYGLFFGIALDQMIHFTTLFLTIGI